MGEQEKLFLMPPSYFTNTVDLACAHQVSHFSPATLSALVTACGFRVLTVDDTSAMGAVVIVATPDGPPVSRSDVRLASAERVAFRPGLVGRAPRLRCAPRLARVRPPRRPRRALGCRLLRPYEQLYGDFLPYGSSIDLRSNVGKERSRALLTSPAEYWRDLGDVPERPDDEAAAT